MHQANRIAHLGGARPFAPSHLSRTLVAAAGFALFALPAFAHDGDRDDDGFTQRHVFTSSNSPAGNEVLVFEQVAGGALSLAATVPTGGAGSGAGLGSQGAVTLSGNGRHLFVVNAQSNTVSVFRVGELGLKLQSVVDSGGLHPISVTERNGLVYVLNDGGAGNVSGFRLESGLLLPIPGSSRALSVATGAAPAQVGLSQDGDTLVVTEKGTNHLSTWAVARNGLLGAATVTPASNLTPFGFAFDARNHLVVTEAVGGAAGASTVSSYKFGDRSPAAPQRISASIPDTQGAACWVATTPDARYAFVANTASSSISRYTIARDGSLTLDAAVAGQTGAGSAPADDAIAADGRHLFVRNGRVATISVFAIGSQGALQPESTLVGLPASAVGLAAN